MMHNAYNIIIIRVHNYHTLNLTITISCKYFGNQFVPRPCVRFRVGSWDAGDLPGDLPKIGGRSPGKPGRSPAFIKLFMRIFRNFDEIFGKFVKI